MARLFRNLLSDGRGFSAIEYALLTSLIGIAISGAIGTVGMHLSNTFATIADAF